MEKPLETLVESLLYEGYALYPYTPTATKNATPTPFGIVYPPAYAEENRGDLRPPAGRLHPPRRRRRQGERDQSASSRRRVTGTRARRANSRSRPRPSLTSPTAASVSEFAFEGEQPVQGRIRLRADEAGPGLARVRTVRPQLHAGRGRRPR